MEEDEYPLTEADVMDALQFVVAAETRDDGHHPHNHHQHNQRSPTPTQPVGVGEEEDAAADDECDDARTAPLVKPLANPYHNRQKQELVYLKRKVRELERELQLVEKENDAKLAQAAGDSLWQRIAQQQNLEKQKALSENARLKEMLEGQIKFAKSLEKVIRKRPNLTAFGSESDAANHGSKSSSRRKKRRSPASLYEELSESVEREFARTNEVLQTSGLAQMVRDHRSIDVAVMDAQSPSSTNSTNTNVADLRLDWTIVRRYPFPFQAVARELWKILSFVKLSGHVPEIERTVDRTDDTLYATTTLKVPVASTLYSMTATALIRQYVEEDSVTVVWVSDGECVPTKGTAKDTFKLYETGWINMQPAPNDPTSCVSRTLGYYFPTFSARSRTDSPTPSSGSENEAGGSPAESSTSQDTEGIGVLTELLSQVYERSASQIHTAIENALMAEAVSQNRTEANSSDL